MMKSPPTNPTHPGQRIAFQGVIIICSVKKIGGCISRHLHKKKGILLLVTGFIDEEEKAVFLKENFDVYSFFEIFQNKDMRDYGYNPDNTADHFNASGCSLIAKALADYIQNHYVISKDK